MPLDRFPLQIARRDIFFVIDPHKPEVRAGLESYIREEVLEAGKQELNTSVVVPASIL